MPGARTCALNPCPWDPQKTYYLVRSAGPDKQFDTGDDMTAYLGSSAHGSGGRTRFEPSAIDVNIEHDRGPVQWAGGDRGNGDRSVGRSGAGSHVSTVREISTGSTRTARSQCRRAIQLVGLACRRLRIAGFRAGVQDRFAADSSASARPRRAFGDACCRHSQPRRWRSTRRMPHGSWPWAAGMAWRRPGGVAGGAAGRRDRRRLLSGPDRSDGSRRPRRSTWPELDGYSSVSKSATLPRTSPAARGARALLFPRGALHQSRNHHRPGRPRQHCHSAGRFHHHVAHGDARFHARTARWARPLRA